MLQLPSVLMLVFPNSTFEIEVLKKHKACAIEVLRNW